MKVEIDKDEAMEIMQALKEYIFNTMKKDWGTTYPCWIARIAKIATKFEDYPFYEGEEE